MNRRPMLDFPRNEAGLVDNFLGTAFDAVYQIYLNLEEVLNSKGYATRAEVAAVAAEAAQLSANLSATNAASSAAAAAQSASDLADAVLLAVESKNQAALSALSAAASAEVARTYAAGLLPPASVPWTTRLDGSPLQYGDRYFNIVTHAENLYKPEGWVPNDSLVALSEFRSLLVSSEGGENIGVDSTTLDEQTLVSRKLANYAALGNYTGSASRVEITQSGISGKFSLVVGDTTTATVPGMLIRDGKGDLWERDFTGAVIDTWFGVKGGDPSFDDGPLLNIMLDYMRTYRVKGILRGTKYYTSVPLDFSGCDLEGLLFGFNNQQGTQIYGDNTFKVLSQGKTGASFITFSLKNIAILQGTVGLAISYAAHSRIENVFITDCDHGLESGQAGVLGPIWCNYKNLRIRVRQGLALNLQGTDFANANIFDTCYFYSEGPSVGKIGASGGIGAIANKFINCEVAGLGMGLSHARAKGTSYDGCYFETQGPPIHIHGQTLDLTLRGCVFGTLRNNNASGIPAFVYHESGTLGMTIDGGYIYLYTGAEFNDLRLVHSALPNSLTLKMLNPPSREISSTGFRLLGDNLPTVNCTMNHQDTYEAKMSSDGSTQPVLGDGTLTGSYTMSGRSTQYHITLTLGSTTNLGTGNLRFEILLPKRAATVDRCHGTVRMSKSGQPFRTGIAEVSQNSRNVTVYLDNIASPVGATVPWVWAAGDILRISIQVDH